MKWIEVADEENWDQVRQIFEPSAEKPHHAGLHTEVLIRRGNPADQILEEADTWGADCIFVGAKGTRGIDRLLPGSVSIQIPMPLLHKTYASHISHQNSAHPQERYCLLKESWLEVSTYSDRKRLDSGFSPNLAETFIHKAFLG